MAPVPAPTSAAEVNREQSQQRAAQPPPREPDDNDAQRRREHERLEAAVDAALGSEADEPFEGMTEQIPWHIIAERTVVDGAAGAGKVRRTEYLLVFEGTDADPEAWYTDEEMLRCAGPASCRAHTACPVLPRIVASCGRPHALTLRSLCWHILLQHD